jgi:hypothetical protein
MLSTYPYPLSLITACTALVASIMGPFVTLTVARRQFKANVLSTNRQKWIDALRDRLAEFLSVASAAQMIKRQSAGDWRGGMGPLEAHPDLADRIERAFLAIAQIRLLTKDAEPEHQALNAAVDAALGCLRDDALRDEDLSACIEEISRLGRNIIRHAWGRVKRGE